MRCDAAADKRCRGEDWEEGEDSGRAGFGESVEEDEERDGDEAGVVVNQLVVE